MNVFISQPMYERDEEEILQERERIFNDFVKWNEENKVFNNKDPYVLIDNYHKENVPENAGRLWFLGNSIQLMDQADVIIFAPNWSQSKGCQVEMRTAHKYDIPVAFYELASFSPYPYKYSEE